MTEDLVGANGIRPVRQRFVEQRSVLVDFGLISAIDRGWDLGLGG